jgi:hypothetical protein
MDSTISQSGLTVTMKYEIVLSSSAFSLSNYLSFGGTTTLMDQTKGTVRDLGGNKLEGTPTSSVELDDRTGKLVPSTDPEAMMVDTLEYSFPAPGKIAVLAEDLTLVLTCK